MNSLHLKIDHLWNNCPFVGETTYDNSFLKRPVTSLQNHPELERSRIQVKQNNFFYDMKTTYNVRDLKSQHLKISRIVAKI